MSLHRFKPFLLILLTICFYTACGGSGASSDGSSNDNSDNDASADTSSIFPHSSNWADVEKHGVTTLELFKDETDEFIGETCQNCHGSDFKGGNTGISCYKCHTVFPHPENWLDTSSSDFHGLTAMEEGLSETCGTECHGSDYSGGLSDKSCYSCHELFPHIEDSTAISDYFANESSTWSDFDLHGAYVQDSNAMISGDCASNCHGTDYSGGLSETSCFDCHQPYPHQGYSNDWASDHISYVNTNTDASCGTENGCHTNKNPGPSTVSQSCTDFCHQ